MEQELIGKKLEEIRDAVKRIEDKTAEKWTLPILIVVITAMMTVANFFISRYYNNEDVYNNKLKEKIAELRAVETVGFFHNSINLLDSANNTFSALCQFNYEKSADAEFSTEMIKMDGLLDRELGVDTAVINRIRTFKKFINENEFVIGSGKMTDEQRHQLYLQSYQLYTSALKQIDLSMNAMVAQ